MMEEFLKLTAAYSFPMVVSAYLLVRMETRIGKLSDSVRELAEAVERNGIQTHD